MQVCPRRTDIAHTQWQILGTTRAQHTVLRADVCVSEIIQLRTFGGDSSCVCDSRGRRAYVSLLSSCVRAFRAHQTEFLALAAITKCKLRTQSPRKRPNRIIYNHLHCETACLIANTKRDMWRCVACASASYHLNLFRLFRCVVDRFFIRHATRLQFYTCMLNIRRKHI